MSRTAPCYSKLNYYNFFDRDFSKKTVLDIGSSVGSFKKSRKFSSAISKLKDSKKYVDLDIDPNSGAQIIADAHELPFEDNSFDFIIANNVIEHFYDPKRAVSEMRRVLKPGGELLFTVPFLYPVHEAPHDYVRFTEYGLKRLFSEFSDHEVNGRGGIFSTVSNYIFVASRAFDRLHVGELFRALSFPFLWLLVQLDRFDKSKAFVRAYFGRAVK